MVFVVAVSVPIGKLRDWQTPLVLHAKTKIFGDHLLSHKQGKERFILLPVTRLELVTFRV